MFYSLTFCGEDPLQELGSNTFNAPIQLVYFGCAARMANARSLLVLRAVRTQRLQCMLYWRYLNTNWKNTEMSLRKNSQSGTNADHVRFAIDYEWTFKKTLIKNFGETAMSQIMTLYLTRWGTSSQWRLSCISCVKPLWNFLVPVMLSPRGQSDLETKILASASASKLWPWPGLDLFVLLYNRAFFGQSVILKDAGTTGRWQ